MENKRPTPASVDDYIAGFSPEVQHLLQAVRAVVRRAAPEAEEVISYQIPAYRQAGMLVYFAAFKQHLGFYPPVKGDAQLMQDIAPYAGDKGNLRFPYSQPMPFELIERITRLRLQQNLDKASAKAASKKAPSKKAANRALS